MSRKASESVTLLDKVPVILEILELMEVICAVALFATFITDATC